LANLRLISICAYLTDGDVKWRPEDHRATKMVKALKGDPIKGYFSSVVGGVWRKYDQSNVHEFVERIPRALAGFRVSDRPLELWMIASAHGAVCS